MKLIINISKDEAQALANFTEHAGLAEMSQENFIKSIFVTGFNTLQENFMKAARDYALANKEELAASGIEVVENPDGTFALKESSVSEEASISGVPHVQA